MKYFAQDVYKCYVSPFVNSGIAKLNKLGKELSGQSLEKN